MSDYWKGKHCLHDAQRPDCKNEGAMAVQDGRVQSPSCIRCCKCGSWMADLMDNAELRALCPEKEG